MQRQYREKPSQVFLLYFIQFDFPIAFIVMWKGLTIHKGLRISFQSSSLDICKAYKDVSNTKAGVQCVGHKGEDFHTQWLIRPRACQKQLVLRVQKFHSSVDNRGTGIMFLLKNQRNTTNIN